mmetsp:Transcript_66766/g.204301  ORF Transcript_66766/g.204301 Transcript_66766/m.204301 type:complete len:215 (-) Transcript_66766:2360-3004(-)
MTSHATFTFFSQISTESRMPWMNRLPIIVAMVTEWSSHCVMMSAKSPKIQRSFWFLWFMMGSGRSAQALITVSSDCSSWNSPLALAETSEMNSLWSKIPFASSMLRLMLAAEAGPFQGRLIFLNSFSQCRGLMAGFPRSMIAGMFSRQASIMFLVLCATSSPSRDFVRLYAVRKQPVTVLFIASTSTLLKSDVFHNWVMSCHCATVSHNLYLSS